MARPTEKREEAEEYSWGGDTAAGQTCICFLEGGEEDDEVLLV